MKRTILILTFTVWAAAVAWAHRRDATRECVYDLRTENMTNPLGIDTAEPHFAWKIGSQARNVVQRAYRIEVASSEQQLADGQADLWDTGWVESGEQLWIAYRGSRLKSNQRAWWKVSVRIASSPDAGAANKELTSSSAATFSVGLLNESHWWGRWIGCEQLAPDEQRGLHTRLAARYVRKEFDARDSISRATLYVAGLGLYDLYVNGHFVGDNAATTDADGFLTAHSGLPLRQQARPAPTDYRRTVLYNTYDVTRLLQRHNAIGVVLGNGRLFPPRQDKPWKIPVFGLPKCRLNLLIEYASGKTERVVTDESWRITTRGPIRANNEYDGETFDARLMLGGWTLPGYDDSQWQAAERAAVPEGTLRAAPVAQMPVSTLPSDKDRTGKTQKNAGKTQKNAGKTQKNAGKTPTPTTAADGGAGVKVSIRGAITTVDVGQNMAGTLAVRVRGKAGDTLRIRYAEQLSADGRLYTDNLRTAQNEDLYICNGSEQNRWWMPRFVYHGFRFAEVSGLADATSDDFMVVHTGDDLHATGTFSCSDTTLNTIYQNAVRGLRANYHGMPVDCPQRDERQPWLGDRTAGALGESFALDVQRTYTKWMRDIRESQREDGCIPDVAPAFWNYYTDDVTWPAALPFGCDMLYSQYGQLQPVSDSYPAISRWLNHILDEYTDRHGCIDKDKYGDWCAPPEAQPKATNALIATAYTLRCMELAARFARLLDRTDDAAYWQKRHEVMATDFNRRFLHLGGGKSPRPGHVLWPDSTYYGSNAATDNLLPLAFGLVPDSLRDAVARQVVSNIVKQNKGHIPTGIIGTSWILRTLSDCGFADVAYALATQTTYPSWGYMAAQGATTTWELWNGDKADPKMNSGNHVMLLGDLLAWCYQYVGGIRTADSYRHIDIRPALEIPDCSHADVTYETPYGTVASRWQKTACGHCTMEVQIPANCEADVHLPDGTVRHVGAGTYQFEARLPRQTQFLFERAPFAQCHASTVAELPGGDLLAAYFGGTKEKNPDCNIYVSRLPHGKGSQWQAPRLVADGGGTACWNPVLTVVPGGEVWLFYKVGKSVPEWTGWVVKSRDGGKTWSRPEPLPDGMLGPAKNKPVVVGNRLVCPSSTETADKQWRPHFEILDLKTRQWKKVEPPRADDSLRIIQPTLLLCGDTLRALCRTRNSRLAVTESTDGGDTWTRPVLTDVPSNGSGIDAVTLADGSHVMVYTPFASLPGIPHGERTPLCVATSRDGLHWQHLATLEDSPVGEYSYPAIIQGRDGSLHITYTWRRLRIAYKHL